MSHSDEFAFMSTSLDNTDIDLSMRAPYIPMNENDDLPLLTEDLMWSAFSDELSLHKDIKEATALQQQPLHLQSTLPSQQFGPDSVEQMIIDGAINGSSVKETTNIGEQRMMFGTASNLASYLASKYVENETVTDDCKQSSNVAHEILKMEQNSTKFEIGSNTNTAIDDTTIKTQQILAKGLNDDSIRSLTPTQITGDASKMEVINAISNDGCITTYTIQMFDNDAFTKNG